MSMIRKMQREIARQRLMDAGYDRVNRRLGWTKEGANKRDAEEKYHRGWKTSRRRAAFLRKRLEQDPPAWRRILWGDLKKKAVEAEKKASLKRAIESEKKKMQKKHRVA